MTQTGTQNRPYASAALWVEATLAVGIASTTMRFDWNNRASVRSFAATADQCIRAGGTVTSKQVTPREITKPV